VTSTDLNRNFGRQLVAVTGASGHLGANLVRTLLADGRRVRVLVRKSSQGIDGLPVEVVRADVLDGNSLDRAFVGVGSVYHLAAKVSAGWEPAVAVSQVNVVGTSNVVKACLAARVRRLVHFSSIQAFAPETGGSAIDETCPLARPGDRSRGAYDIAKAEAERLVLAAVAAGLDAVIVNPTTVIGPFDFQPSPMGEVLLTLAHGRLPAIISGGGQDFVDVRDVISAALMAERQGRRGERYILSGTAMSLVDLAHLWAKVTGRPAPRFAAPMGLARLAAPLAFSWARLRHRRPLLTSESLRMLRARHPVSRLKAESELGYHPRPIEETLRDTWAWMKEEGRL
jgi:dihydroflavonol-4-reductase